ncbi:MAG: hypothetical protein AB7I30_17355 [Isosphaeraceae bacterium]
MPFSWFTQRMPIASLPTLGFLIPGAKEILLVVLVALALYGRGGSRLLMTTRYGRMLSPWVRVAETARPKQGGSRRGGRTAASASKVEPTTSRPKGRLFWALALIAAALAAAWVATRVVIQHAASLPPPSP